MDGSVPEPSSPWRVLGTGLTLLVFLAALVWSGAGLFTKPVDGARFQGELFGEAPPPFGLLLDSAVRLPTGDTLVRFARPTVEGPGPSELILIEYRSRVAVEALFRPPEMMGMGEPPMGGGTGGAGGPPSDPAKRLEEWQKDKGFDWHFTMKRDELAWGDYSSKFLIERSFKKGDAWYEEARVDLRSPARALVLFAHWPRETAVNEAELRELLHAVVVPDLGAKSG